MPGFIYIIARKGLVACMAAGLLAGGAGAQLIDSTVEDLVEEELNQQVEEDLTAALEQQVEEGVEQAVEQQVEEQVEAGVTEAVEQQVESGVVEAIEQQVETTVEQQIESQVDQTLDVGLDGVLEQGLDDLVESQLTEPLEEVTEALQQTDAEGVAGQIESGDAGGDAQAGETFLPDVDEDGWTIERDIWVLLLAPEDLGRVEEWGFTVREQQALEALDLVMVRVDAPADSDLAEAALELALEAPGTEVDRNHVYRGEAGEAAAAPKTAARPAGAPRSAPAIGLIDSAVALEHEALLGARITQRDFVPYAAARPQRHGTAVASILVGRSRPVQGRLGEAELYAASVFFADQAGAAAATTASLVQALAWMTAQGVPVVNMSLSGPPNRVLEATIERVSAQRTVVVAAVGNNGPAGEALYPAAYAPVVGVTAVDARHRVYRYANRGRQVTFAAPGVRVKVARSDGGYGSETGTSMAAPHAAAIIAQSIADAGQAPEMVLSALKERAVDLGEKDFDETYGFGLIAAFE